MGLDILLGLFILASGVRGWFRGFVLQAIRLAGPDRLRSTPRHRSATAARPYLGGYLPSMRPELLDRLLWWSSAVLCYVVTVGLASLAVKMARRRPFGEVEPNRTDQFAGFFLGGVKGAVIVAFLAAVLHRHAVDRVKGIDWADQQAKESYALRWDGQYRPAERMWTSRARPALRRARSAARACSPATRCFPKSWPTPSRPPPPAAPPRLDLPTAPASTPTRPTSPATSTGPGKRSSRRPD